MANILQFLQSNPEMAFRLLQAGGGGLSQIGSQFDNASAYNSQNRANRKNSLVGALSLGQVPGTAQGRMPNPGFLSTLGQGAELVGGMGSMAYDLKRQKAEEEYQERLRKLEAEKARLSIDVLSQDKQQNQYILGKNKEEDAIKEGAKYFSKMYVVGYKDHQKKYADQKVSEIPPYDPSNLVIPDEFLGDENRITGWKTEFENAFDKYQDQELKRQRALVDAQNAETNKVEADIRMLEAKRRADMTGDRSVLEKEKMRQRLFNEIRGRAANAAREYKVADLNTAFIKASSAYNAVDPATGQRTPQDGILIKTAERLINPDNQVTLQEFRTSVAEAMSLSGQILNDWKNLGKLPNDMPLKLNAAARDRVMGYIVDAYNESGVQFDQQLSELVSGYQNDALSQGFVVTPSELYEKVKYTRVQRELAKPFETLGTTSQIAPQVSQARELFNTDREAKFQSTSPETTSTDSTGQDSILQGGTGGFNTDTILGMSALGGLYGALGYGGYKALKKGASIFNRPDTGTSIPPAAETPSIFKPVSAQSGPFNYDKPDFVFGGQSSPLLGRLDPERGPFVPNSPGINPNDFDMTNPAGTVKYTDLPKVAPKPSSPLPVQSSYRFPTSSSWSPSAPQTTGINPQDFAPSSYEPNIPFSNPDAPPAGYNAFANMNPASGVEDALRAGGSAPSSTPKPVDNLSPSALKRYMKNPALAKALGYLDSADRYMGGFAGGLVNTKMLQDWVNKSLYGPRGYD